MIKLHLGCGEKFLPGYKHVDLIQYDHIDYITSLDNLYMFKNNSVDEIYACHCLEHFKRFEILKVLYEWNRVLQSNSSVLRIAVPNFEAITMEYLKNRNLNDLLGLLHGRQNYEYNFHYNSFDFNTLKDMLEYVGFSNINLYEWKDFLPLDFDDYSRSYLPHMDFSKGRLMSLNIIAYKNK